ncbi:MAG TPA: HPr family phosphocarrier protein [Verrucomicrobiae bacterium]|nr:HPr family phosphocarrier protein [Verrucomicrobiae bacterium]
MKKKPPKEDELPEATREVIVSNKLGIHSRPAALFVRIAGRFKCMIFVEKDREVYNAKSHMSMLNLAAGPGAKLLIRARGEDAEQAVEALADLVHRGFEEK